MQLATRSDAELVRLARQGVATAFAALVHRHAPVVRATLATGDDPEAAVVATFVRAMRSLDELDPDELDPDEPVAAWLQRLAHDQGADPAPVAPDRAPAIDQDELDRIWLELARRWPTGRRPLRLPRWLVHGVAAIALLAASLALGVLGPYIALTTAGDRAPTAVVVAEVTAEPYDGQLELTTDDPDGTGDPGEPDGTGGTGSTGDVGDTGEADRGEEGDA